MAQERSDSERREGEKELPESRQSGSENRETQPLEESDFLLDIPDLKIDELNLEVEDLRADVSARAELADFLKINIGVETYLNQPKLEVKGVEAQVALKVELGRILGTIERALSVLEENPELLDSRVRKTDHDVQESAPPPEPDEDGEKADRKPGEVRATDAARRRAEELQADLSAITGTGSGGRIVVRDVVRSAKNRT